MQSYLIFIILLYSSCLFWVSLIHIREYFAKLYKIIRIVQLSIAIIATRFEWNVAQCVRKVTRRVLITNAHCFSLIFASNHENNNHEKKILTAIFEQISDSLGCDQSHKCQHQNPQRSRHVCCRADFMGRWMVVSEYSALLETPKRTAKCITWSYRDWPFCVICKLAI